MHFQRTPIWFEGIMISSHRFCGLSGFYRFLIMQWPPRKAAGADQTTHRLTAETLASFCTELFEGTCTVNTRTPRRLSHHGLATDRILTMRRKRTNEQWAKCIAVMVQFSSGGPSPKGLFSMLDPSFNPKHQQTQEKFWTIPILAFGTFWTYTKPKSCKQDCYPRVPSSQPFLQFRESALMARMNETSSSSTGFTMGGHFAPCVASCY